MLVADLGWSMTSSHSQLQWLYSKALIFFVWF